ncbi:sodium:solute symporter [Pseudobacillus sp. 179-B 2D1 NHS]|uniref:sodium:solute symporter n=1 Tax=Pseudobacillus sp. 179-B 2D1 NHS TaxID=3374292 RepID=UPI0038796F21
MNIATMIILAFLLFCLFLGIQAKKGKEMNMEQWAVGGRGFGYMFVFILMAGEGYSTFTMLGASGWAYSKGVPAYYVLSYTALAFAIGYWLLPPIWRYAKEHNIVSQPDFFTYKYKSKPLGVLTAVVGIIAMIPYIIIQFKGLGIIVSETSYGTISPTLSVIIGMICITIYVMISGIHGSAWTAVIKDILVFFIIAFLGIYLPYHYYGGLQPMFEAVSAAKPDVLTFSESGLSISWFISTVLLSVLGLYMWPHSLVPVFSAKNEKTFKKNAIMMPAYTLMLLFVFFVGFAAILKVPGLVGAEGDLALLRISVQTFSPWFVGLIGAAGLLSALVLSSILLMTTSTILANNIYKLFDPGASSVKVGKIAKLCVPLVSLLCLYFTLGNSNSLTVLFLSGFSIVTQLFPAFFASLFKKNPFTTQGAFVGITLGVSVVLYTTITQQTMGTLFPHMPQVMKDLNIGVLALVINMISMSIVSAVPPKHSSLAGQESKEKVI